ncbi:hypothetical protein Drose_15850 [Dactylosporangium roseum]|uniref:Uncharacterized protein n=1 Tax=Dactylosporangium roseum TaxID=47989 RepID=A0ABY5ZH26_9ACTN|nr:hypothetical protein [Dactylosporangium roseum]UWZ39569.1 hypothetical protein Drose_15850 [Dactylosporangium roseum]
MYDTDKFFYEQPGTFSGGRWFSSGPVRIGDPANVDTEYYLHVVVVDQTTAEKLDQVRGMYKEAKLPGTKLGTKNVKRNQIINC